jgi:hypothetical protein
MGTHEVSPRPDVREDGSGLCLVVVGTETVNQIVVVQHVYPDMSAGRGCRMIDTYMGMDELARPKALLRKILQ